MGRSASIRRMWGIDIDEEFGGTGPWSEEEMRIFEEIGERERSKKEAENIEEEEAEEGNRPIYKDVEPRPSKNDIEEHMMTHIPFRSWCPHCVRGKAKAAYHNMKAKGPEDISVVSMDYMYMETAESDDRGMPILVTKDRTTGWTSARVVPKKGKHPYAVKGVMQDIEWMGYKKVILKSDQEPAILEVKDIIKKESIGDIM